MAFDVSAGLSSMGEAVAKTAGAYTLEIQKAEQQKQMIVLADEMAGARESRGRQEQGLINSAAAEKSQAFQSGEKALDRAHSEKLSEAQRQAALAAASISAGASMTNARLAADVHRESLTPAEVRTAKWFATASPEEKTAFQEVLLAKLPPVKPPEGYRRTEAGLEPIPGGPADPATIKDTSEAKGKAAPPGYRATGDGKLKFIPGGPADPSIVKRASPMTEGQANAALYADRMRAAEKIILENEKAGLSLTGRALEGVAGGNYAQSEAYQLYEQARRDFINAVLRRESGAVISEQEFANAEKQYFPRPGDKPETMKQKAENRRVALEGISRAAGSSYKPTPNVDVTPPTTAAPTAIPPVEKRAIGKVYQTPTGPYIWMGNGWAKPPEVQ